MTQLLTRRQWLSTVSTAMAGLYLEPPSITLADSAPTAPVAIAKCSGYDGELLPTLERMFDQLGGMSRLDRKSVV